MAVINTNVGALAARNALANNQRAMDTAMERLSTGSKINRASDDAAGIAQVQTMTAYRRGLDMAVKNAEDAISLLQTAEGAIVEQSAMLQRMRELAVQASNDTLSDTDRDYLQAEFAALRTEVDRIGANTQWNGSDVLDGTPGTSGAMIFLVGANDGAGQRITITLPAMIITSGEYAAMSSTDISTSQATAEAAIGTIDTLVDTAAAKRTAIGAVVNQLSHAIENLSNVSMNTSASISRIQDTDYAVETTELARAQIIQQAATAMLAQANQAPASVLALLQ